MTDWAIVGLGNPGPGYAGNRHNVGAMVVEELAGQHSATLRRHKADVRAAQVRLAPRAGQPGASAVIAVPNTFMNVSGPPVRRLMDFFSVAPDHLIVIHDELDIDFGALRLKLGGGEGGHNGLRSISSSLGTKDYFRLRVGIGRPPGRMDAASFVLKDFAKAEREELGFVLPDAVDAISRLIDDGLTAAQNVVHAR